MEQYNEKVLLVVLKHYFYNLQSLVSTNDILNYYYTLEDYINSDPTISWQEIGSNYLISSYFKHINPCDVLKCILSLYSEIIVDLQLQKPNIVINPLEVASDIALQQVISYYTEILTENYEYTTDDGETFLTEDAQDDFNSKFNEILLVLNNGIRNS